MNNSWKILGLVAVLAIGAAVASIGFGVWPVASEQSLKNDGQSQLDTQERGIQETLNEADPQLENLGLSDFAQIDITTNATREFSRSGLKGFYVFGDRLEGNRQNPTFEYASLKQGTNVVAAIDGVVAFIKEQPESNDVEVFLQPREGSVWTIGYDHLTNVTVQRGDTVKAGDVLGEPAVQNNGLLRFELQVNKDERNGTTHVCPTTLLAASVRDKWVAALMGMQGEWETVTGLELYDQPAQSPAGCVKQTLTVAEAEGR